MMFRKFEISPLGIVNAATGKEIPGVTLPSVDHNIIAVFHSSDDMLLNLKRRSDVRDLD